MPIAAPSEYSSPAISAKKLPNVAPTKNTGTISPPLKPAQRVSAVNAILRIKASEI